MSCWSPIAERKPKNAFTYQSSHHPEVEAATQVLPPKEAATAAEGGAHLVNTAVVNQQQQQQQQPPPHLSVAHVKQPTGFELLVLMSGSFCVCFLHAGS